MESLATLRLGTWNCLQYGLLSRHNQSEGWLLKYLPNLTRIQVSSVGEKFFEAIGTFCPNLKELKVCSPDKDHKRSMLPTILWISRFSPRVLLTWPLFGCPNVPNWNASSYSTILLLPLLVLLNSWEPSPIWEVWVDVMWLERLLLFCTRKNRFSEGEKTSSLALFLSQIFPCFVCNCSRRQEHWSSMSRIAFVGGNRLRGQDLVRGPVFHHQSL